MTSVIIVSRHAGALEWLAKHHPDLAAGATVISKDEKGNPRNALPEDVKGKIVVGTLPMRLAALTTQYWEIDIDIPSTLRGKEIDLATMEKLDAKLTHYSVREISSGIIS